MGESFRVNAKVTCKKSIRKRKLSSISDDSYTNRLETRIEIEDDNVENTRGLELAVNTERKKRKFYANKIIIAAQKSMKAKELATLSSTLSNWARDNAINDFVCIKLSFLSFCV